MMNDNSLCERQALAHAVENLINTNDQDSMLPAASCSHLDLSVVPAANSGQIGAMFRVDMLGSSDKFILEYLKDDNVIVSNYTGFLELRKMLNDIHEFVTSNGFVRANLDL
jgi:hypothetical protein